MILWAILACLTAAIVVYVVTPLYRRSHQAADGAHEIELYKAQLDEIAIDVRRGVISEIEAADVSREISRRLLAASAGNQKAIEKSKKGGVSSNWATVSVAAAVAVISLAIYISVGSPQMPGQPLSARLEAPDVADNVEAMVAKVEARLRSHPEDGTGWNVIAPVYMRLQRFEDAAEAFGKAMSLLGETPERLAGFGEASIAASDGIASTLARSALQKALEQRPDLLRARFFLALADENQGDKAAARAGYERLLKSSLAPEWRQAVEGRLAALDGKSLPEPSAAADAAETQKRIEGMVAGLADRLGRNGGEVSEWLGLVRAYSVLGKKEDAMAAVEKAKTQFAGNLDALKQIDDFAAAMGLKS